MRNRYLFFHGLSGEEVDRVLAEYEFWKVVNMGVMGTSGDGFWLLIKGTE